MNAAGGHGRLAPVQAPERADSAEHDRVAGDGRPSGSPPAFRHLPGRAPGCGLQQRDRPAAGCNSPQTGPGSNRSLPRRSRHAGLRDRAPAPRSSRHSPDSRPSPRSLPAPRQSSSVRSLLAYARQGTNCESLSRPTRLSDPRVSTQRTEASITPGWVSRAEFGVTNSAAGSSSPDGSGSCERHGAWRAVLG